MNNMNTLVTRLTLALVLFACGAYAAVGADDTPPTKSGAVQTIKVSGTDLTGLNAISITNLLDQAKQQGTSAVVVDMGSVTHMTPSGMDALVAGAQSFGPERFAVANLSGQPAEVVQSEGAGRLRTFASVQDAVAALKAQ